MKVSSDSKTALKTIQDAKSIGLLVSEGANADAVSAAMALFHLLSLTCKAERVVPIVPGKIPSEAQSLPSSIEIKHGLGPKNLVVTLDTNHTPVEKVSYRSEGEKFQLVIHPVRRSFEVENIKYSYEGLDFDLLITLGVRKLTELGELYEKNRAEFEKAVIINMDVSSQNENYGQINIVDPSLVSVSELIFHQLLAWELVPSKEVAQCLLTGLAAVSPIIEFASNPPLVGGGKPAEVPGEKKIELTSGS